MPNLPFPTITTLYVYDGTPASSVVSLAYYESAVCPSVTDTPIVCDVGTNRICRPNNIDGSAFVQNTAKWYT